MSQLCMGHLPKSKAKLTREGPEIRGRNLVIKTHSQHPKKRTRSKLPRHEMSAVQAGL